MLGIIIGILIVLLSIAIYLKSTRQGNAEEITEGGPTRARGGQRGLARMRRGMNEPPPGEEETAELLEEAGVKIPEGKVGKKKMEKLQQKAEKRLAREAEERDREERKKQRAKELEESDAQRELERQQELQMEKEEEERLQALKQKEEEEYARLKEAFVVDTEGFDEADPEENTLSAFIDYIKDTKMVLLEDLASHFKMRTQDTIDRVMRLQEDGLLSGVIDDRGKFIYVSPEELEEVAKFIRQRGRVSIAEIAENSHKLIKMSPLSVT